MAIRQILKEGNDILRKQTREVTNFDEKLWTLLDDMVQTMIVADGVGFAAPQIGILRRIFIVDTGEKVLEFINPQILSFEGTQVAMEGCLSVPGKHAMVDRPYIVTVKAQDRYGNEFIKTLNDLSARAVFHENDHLYGVLFIDNAGKEYNDDELEEYIKMELEKKEQK